MAFRAMVPNAVTALALCFGLTGVRFAFSAASGHEAHWELALACVIGAGVLDGMDGRIARLLRAQSRFGAELDSLSDVSAFGVAPALIMYLWSLHQAPQFGWVAALALAVCCALRLARFNSRMDADDQPHKSAGYLTGVPAPAGAGLAFVPVYLWLVTGEEIFRAWYVVMPWVIFIALLLISSVATFSWSSLAHSPLVAAVRDRRDRPARGGAGDRPVDHAAGDFAGLCRDAAVQHRLLRPRQAAARQLRLGAQRRLRASALADPNRDRADARFRRKDRPPLQRRRQFCTARAEHLRDDHADQPQGQEEGEGSQRCEHQKFLV